jgi:signal transduction histidine kinase
MAGDDSRPRRWVTSVRFRVVAVAILTVAATLAAAGVIIVWQVNRAAVASVVDVTDAEAGDVAASLVRGPLPARFEAVHPGTEVQVVDDHRRVVSATTGLGGRPPVSDVRPPLGREVRFDDRATFMDDHDPDVGVALGVRTPQGSRVVYVVGSTEAAEQAARNSLLPLSLVLLSLLAVTAAVIWVLVGRALSPVERIRAQVARISGGDLHQRVDEPSTDDEVGRLARTMNAMLARLETSADRQAQFVSDASHELRSPLAALLTELEVARRRPEAADWPAVAGAAFDDGLRLQRIVDDLLLLARSDEGQLRPRLGPVDLDELALEEGSRVRGRGKVAVDLRRVGAARVRGDVDLLRRLVRNLVENAERHADTVVRLDVRHWGSTAEFAVADDGPGIPADRREWVFERFARLEDGRSRSSGGTGLGLAIAREIAQVHGGSVAVADSTEGACFVVRLPADDQVPLRPAHRDPLADS